MRIIKVTIKEKDKNGKNLSFLSLRDELVNFLYKDTVANSTKADMQFFVLLFFLSAKAKNETYLEIILRKTIPDFKVLTNSLSNKKTYLQPGEYKKLVKEYGLSKFLQNDIFFVIVEALLNIDELESRFNFYIKTKLISESVNL